MSAQTLYDIQQEFDALDALLFEVGGDVTDEDAAAAIDAWLAEAKDALRGKLDAYGAKIRERESLAKARKEEADRIAALARTDENLVKRLKERLLEFFEAEGIEKYETDRFKFSLANNGGKAPVILHVEPEYLPAWAQRVTVSADMEAIRGEIEERVRSGAELPDFAEIGERGKHLRVR